MAITTCLTDSFRVDLLDGTGHDFGATPDTYKIALYVDTASMGYGTTAYTTSSEVASGGGYTTAGNTLTLESAQPAVDTTNHVAHVDFVNETWSSSTITARGCLIYNTSKSNASVYVGDFGENKSSSTGDFTVQFPAPAYNTSIIRLA